jgi:hypothetical protein
MLLTRMPVIKNKIEDAVSRLNLDLSGKVVLTEAATGAYIVTPVIAALAVCRSVCFYKRLPVRFSCPM